MRPHLRTTPRRTDSGRRSPTARRCGLTAAGRRAAFLPSAGSSFRADDGSATVSVTQHETGVENASLPWRRLTTPHVGSGTTRPTATGRLDCRPRAVRDGRRDGDGRQSHCDDDGGPDCRAERYQRDRVRHLRTRSVSLRVRPVERREPDRWIGPAVARFVTANNPGNAPDHAARQHTSLVRRVRRQRDPPQRTTGSAGGHLR